MSDELNNSNPGDELRQRFPRMKPIKGPPSLFTLNGFGVSVYGRRAVDQETGTYIKTQVITALFVPLLALRAYRVADAENGGWYFLGRERLSSLATTWNLFVAFMAVFYGLQFGWMGYTQSPAYQARTSMAEAETHMIENRPVEAAKIYWTLMNKTVVSRDEVRARLGEALAKGLESPSLETVSRTLNLVTRVPESWNQPTPLVLEPLNRGLELAEKFKASDPEGALSILLTIAPLDQNNEELFKAEVKILTQMISNQPEATNRVIELALVYERHDQLPEALTLLRSHRDKLGDTEGARILGQALLSEGDIQGAYPLLYAFVQPRLKELHRVEMQFTNELNALQDRAIKHLNDGKATGSFYQSYEKATPEEQQAMVDKFISDFAKTDSHYLRVLAQLRDANQIVHVALDLGIAQVNRAQSLTDPAARNDELRAAESTFLAIRGLAGDSDQYRLFLGQVYYWLGKSEEGQKLFDQLLASNQREFSILLALSRTLRQVGEISQARVLSEEAYNVATNDMERSFAAGIRGHVSADLEEKIKWLALTDTNQILNRVALYSAQGNKALMDGDKKKAASFIQAVIKGYADQPRDSTTLNNWGLAYLALHKATGSTEHYQRGQELLEEAIQLDPGNSLLLGNVMHQLLSKVIWDVVHDHFDLEALAQSPSLEMLTFLYTNDSNRQILYDQVKENPGMNKVLAYLDKTMLLAPKDLNLYRTGLELQRGFRNSSALEQLLMRLQQADPDMTEFRQDMLDYYKGDQDAEMVESLKNSIASYEKLLATPAVQSHSLTRNYVRIYLNNLKQGAWTYGFDVNTDELLKTALECDGQHPSMAARQSLISASYLRALDELKTNNEAMRKLFDQTKRSLTVRYMIILALEQSDALAKAVLANEHVQAALKLELAQLNAFPMSASAEDWGLFRTTHPAEAGRVLKHINSDLASQLGQTLDFKLNPMSGWSVLKSYWRHTAQGDVDQARTVYNQALSEGVPLPPL